MINTQTNVTVKRLNEKHSLIVSHCDSCQQLTNGKQFYRLICKVWLIEIND